MRTTITLPDELVEQTLKMTGKTRLSEAVSQLLDESIRRKKQIDLMNDLFDHPLPKSMDRLRKKPRRRRGLD